MSEIYIGNITLLLSCSSRASLLPFMIGKILMLPDKMHAVLLTGHGGMEKLDYRTDVLIPQPKPGELLIQIAAERPCGAFVSFNRTYQPLINAQFYPQC